MLDPDPDLLNSDLKFWIRKNPDLKCWIRINWIRIHNTACRKGGGGVGSNTELFIKDPVSDTRIWSAIRGTIPLDLLHKILTLENWDSIEIRKIKLIFYVTQRSLGIPCCSYHKMFVWIRILLFSSLILSLYGTFWRYIYIIFQRWRVKKKLQNSRNQGFSYYFCLIMEGSGSKSLTSGSGSAKLVHSTVSFKWTCSVPYYNKEKVTMEFRLLSTQSVIKLCNIIFPSRVLF